MAGVTSCDDATAPILITKNTSQICNLKCSYSFNYPFSNLSILNHGDYISWKTDDTNISPVVFTDELYNVQEVRIYWKSIHSYGRVTTKADAEMCIIHTNAKSTKNLIVCVPIIKSSSATDECTILFDVILGEISRTAPAAGDQTTYTDPKFTLNKFVPMKPYFSYIGTLPWPPWNGEYSYVVFHLDNAIKMSPQAYGILSGGSSGDGGVITKNPSGGNKGDPANLFYNDNGPTKPNSGEIYIDCQPTGDDGEVLVAAKVDTGGILDNEVLKSMWSKKFVKILVGALIMLALWMLAAKMLGGIASGTAKAASKVINNATKVDI